MSCIGSGYAIGPWHAAVYLVRTPDTDPVESLAGEVLVGQGLSLGPGQSFTATASIRVGVSWEPTGGRSRPIPEGRFSKDRMSATTRLFLWK